MLHSVKAKQQGTGRQARPAKQITKRIRSYGDIVNALPTETKDKLVFDKAVYTKGHSVTKWLLRYGMAVLSRHEFVFVGFLAARTVAFGKRAEMITKSQFLKGVWQKEAMVCAPLRMAERDLYKTISSLEAKGILVVTPVSLNGQKLPTIYEFAIDFITTLRPSEATMCKLREPRAKKSAEIIDFSAAFNAKRTELDGVKRHQPSTSWMVSNDTINNIKVKTEKNELVAVASLDNETAKTARVRRAPRAGTAPTIELDCKARIREAIDVASRRSTDKRESRAQHAAHGVSVSLTDLNAAWKQALVDAYGSCTVVGLTHKEFGMFKRIVKGHTLDCSWLVFFTWVVTNWARINKESRDLSSYKAKQSGEWSLREEDIVFLGSDAPDMFMAIKNFGKLAKRYSQQMLMRKAGVAQDTPEVLALKAKLARSEQDSKVKDSLLQKALRTNTQTTVKSTTVKPVAKTVNPATDKFFHDDNDNLPKWK